MSSYDRPQSGAVTAVGVLSIIYGALHVLGGVLLLVLGARLLAMLGLVDEAVAQSGGDEKAKEAVSGAAKIILSVLYFCAGGVIIYGVLPILGGISVIKRKGKTMTFVF